MGRNLMAYQGIKIVLAVVSGLILLQTTAIILQAKWLSDVITSLFQGEALGSKVSAICGFIVAFLARQFFAFAVKKVCLRFGERTVEQLRTDLLESIFALGPRFTKKEGTGNLVTFLIEGLSKLRNYLELFIPKMAAIGITPWILLAYVWMNDSLSGLILLVTMPILIIFMILLGLAAKKKIDDRWDSYRVLSNHFVDSLRGLETLKFLGRSREHAETIEKVSGRYRKSTMGTLRIAFLSTFALDFFTMLSVAIVAVTLGLRLVDGTLLLEPALLVLLLAPEYFLPIREVGNDYHATLDGKEAGDAILKVIKQAETVSRAGTAPEWKADSSLELKCVAVCHEGHDEPALKDISLAIKGNKKVGIVGASGAGKSTFVDVLSGFLSANKGQICVNEKEVKLACQDWQQQTAYIPQHPFIFQGTIKENIRFYCPNATDEQVLSAIELAGLTGIVIKFPNKENELIGDGGRVLSGGQAQRIALARAFLSNRPVLLLDEPTAQLDIETEYELKDVLLRLSENKLMFFASHRLHWMKDMDLIVVMAKGRIVETGTHYELLHRQGAYYRLLRVQMGDAS
ncbi:thiol reductant ABC exporter subunit CydD [Bacillus gobiensis]|uniref:thiol reductant ABC exporter subunit CydD n=1 Tax=Bacillus gobiensis TaxID=1441095 RepID=UPI003D1E1A53